MIKSTENSAVTDQPALSAISAAFDSRIASAATEWPAWPRQNRVQAMRSFARTGFPHSRLEEWKYTNLQTFASRSSQYLGNEAVSAPSENVSAILSSIPVDDDEYRVVFINGVHEPALSSLPPADGSLTVNIFSAANDVFGLAEKQPVDTTPLVALNSAFMSDGLEIKVPDGQSVDTPIHVLLVTDGAPCAAQARLSILIGKDASASVIQHHAGQGKSLVNTVTTIECAENSQLSFIKLQNESLQSQYVANQFVDIAANAHFDYLGLDFGCQLARSDLNVSLRGSRASADISGVFMANDDRHVDNHLRVDHIAEHTISKEDFRGILGDDARGVFNGKIIVHSGADGTDANMSNHNLLLGERAEIDTKPELEIYTDDVKCAHGSTTGRLDHHSLFYLRARGISEDEARRMLVAAFAHEIIHRATRVLPAYESYLDELFSAQLAMDDGK